MTPSPTPMDDNDKDDDIRTLLQPSHLTTTASHLTTAGASPLTTTAGASHLTTTAGASHLMLEVVLLHLLLEVVLL